MKRHNVFREIYDKEEYKNAHSHPLPNSPYIVDVEVTNNCNLRCIFCSQKIMTRDRGYMSSYVFDKIVDECKVFNCGIRFIRWGEPFLHPNILKFIKRVKDNDLPLHITNNGLVITEDHMKSIIDLGVDSIIFSMQGATKKEYQKMRNNNQYDKLKKNILKLVELRGNKKLPFIHISCTMLNDSEKDIKAFKKYWEGIVDSVGVGVTNMSRIDDNNVKKEHVTCNEVFNKLSVDWDGKITACCGDYDNLLTIGNIRNDTLYNIWNNSGKLRCIRKLLSENCHRFFVLCSKCYPAYNFTRSKWK